MLRAASIGMGWWSDELADAIQGKSDAIRVVTCFSRSADRRSAFAAKYGTDQHESYAAALSDPEIDAVLLTTPHTLHAEQTIEAARAGKHVFVEKPFTLTVESGKAAIEACRAAGVVLAVGHNRRFNSAVAEIKRRVDDGSLGTILHIEANMSTSRALTYVPDQWRADRTESPAGALTGLGIHMIDTATSLLGPIKRVSAQSCRRAVRDVDLDDTTSALFAFESGATGYLGTLFACPFTSYVNVYGTKANAFAQVDASALIVHEAGGEPVTVPLEPADTLRLELDEFAAACAGRVDFRVTPEEALHDIAVMEALIASAERGEWVETAS